MTMKQYTIHEAVSIPGLDGDWEGPAWGAVPVLAIDHFHENGSDHRPIARAKVLHSPEGVHVIFRVEDRWVRCVTTQRNGSVCGDSCVEFFTEPVAGRGYFNFEINCGGTMLLHFNAFSGTVKYDPVVVDDARMDRVPIYHSMPETVEPEMTEPATWFVEFFAPYEIFESFVGSVPRHADAFWRSNLYKCGDHTSHPHWAMWNPMPGPLNFHKPEFFSSLRFAGPVKSC